jgi:hypothetical protein
MGAVLTALAAIGIARAPWGDSRRRLTALLIVGGTILIAARFPGVARSAGALRLLYPLAALAVVMGADVVCAAPRTAAALLLAAVFVDTGVRGGVYAADLAGEAGARNTRAAAADWIDANVPSGANIGLLRFPEPAHTPPFRWDRYRLSIFESTAALAERETPEWIVARRAAWDVLERSFRNRYDEVREFPSARWGWAETRDDSFFADAGMIVLRRSSRPR